MCKKKLSDLLTEKHESPYCVNRAIGLEIGIVTLRQEIKQLKQWVNDLHSGMYINCVYCGHKYGPKDKIPASMADALKKHVEKCPKHPMSLLKTENEQLKKEMDRRWVKTKKFCKWQDFVPMEPTHCKYPATKYCHCKIENCPMGENKT